MTTDKKSIAVPAAPELGSQWLAGEITDQDYFARVRAIARRDAQHVQEARLVRAVKLESKSVSSGDAGLAR